MFYTPLIYTNTCPFTAIPHNCFQNLFFCWVLHSYCQLCYKYYCKCFDSLGSLSHSLSVLPVHCPCIFFFFSLFVVYNLSSSCYRGFQPIKVSVLLLKINSLLYVLSCLSFPQLTKCLRWRAVVLKSGIEKVAILGLSRNITIGVWGISTEGVGSCWAGYLTLLHHWQLTAWGCRRTGVVWKQMCRDEGDWLHRKEGYEIMKLQ